MSTHPKVLGKMIPSDTGIASTTAGHLPTRSRCFSGGPPLGHLSRAAREEIPVQLGNRAHDGGTPSRLGLKQRLHVRRSLREDQEDVQRAKTRKGQQGLEEALLLAAPADSRPFLMHRTRSGAIIGGRERD
jgi:hypothetical protein